MFFQATFAQKLDLFTNSQVFSSGQPLLVYGNATSEENLIIRLFAPDGTIAKFDQINTKEDGSFNHVLLTWPESSPTFPYGTYTIEAISTVQEGFSQKIDLKFTSTSELVDVPVERQINTLVFAPETAAIDKTLRVFVQTTSDGLLIAGNPDELLETTHVHLPSGDVEGFTKKYKVSQLVWYERHETAESAIKKERNMKEWKRQWKIELIEKFNPNWWDLYDNIAKRANR